MHQEGIYTLIYAYKRNMPLNLIDTRLIMQKKSHFNSEFAIEQNLTSLRSNTINYSNESIYSIQSF